MNNFIQSFDNKTILIPLLQRDYVQGGREDVIGPFMDSLLDLEKESDLNYIYGYKEKEEKKEYFVPVDGQQRLITLWLLYLYLYARKSCKNDFKVHLKFASREYAEDFCENLSEHIEELLKPVGDDASLDEIIINQNWFIRSWLSNASVRNMLGTLKVIHKKIKKDTFPSRLAESDTPSIFFAFLPMDEDNGLDDDIYIKMNGRGRRLSAFENLKSYMDEHVSDFQFANEWKSNMDNVWTDLFWKNRNQQQEHPEEIDDEQLYCLYNLLILYHIDKIDKDGKGELLETVEGINNEPHRYEDLTAFLEKNGHTEEKEIVAAIIERLQKAGNFPLVWFERLKLMSEGFYNFAFNMMNQLVKLSDEFNSMDLYIGSTSEKTTKTYQLCMCESSFNRTLPLLYALLSYKAGETSLDDWMRTMRNLILNTDISSKNLPEIMHTIDAFSEQCKGKEIYTVLKSLTSDEAKSLLKGFNGNQVEEEIMKASELAYKKQMTLLENGSFFRGCIGILFRLLPHEDKEGYDKMSPENAEAYSSILLDLFDGKDGGISSVYDDDNSFLLRRALMSYYPYRFGKERKNQWSFNKGIVEWREYINEKASEIGSFQALLKELLVPAFKLHKDIKSVLSEHVDKISKQYKTDIVGNDENKYRFHFIHYPDIWEYMSTQRCKWGENNFDIELRASNSNNSNRMELRTYCLYLDYAYAPETYEGWEIGIYQKEETCFYFNFKASDETIAIDVYNRDRNSEDSYAFDLFVRDAENEEEELVHAKGDNFNFSSVIPEKMELFENKDGRLHSKRLYTRLELKEELEKIMNGIKEWYQDRALPS